MKRQRMPRAVTRFGMRVLNRANPPLASVFGLGLMQDLVESQWDDAALRQRQIEPRSATDFLEQQARSLGYGAGGD